MSDAVNTEAGAAIAALQAAFAKIGAEVVIDLLGLWSRSIDAVRIDATEAVWLPRAQTVIAERRAQVRDLTMAFYRLTRALHTGRTAADPLGVQTERTTLGQLREDFYNHLADAEVPRSEYEIPAQAAGDDVVVEVEDIGWTKQDDAELEADAAEEAVDQLTAKGTENLRRKVRITDRRESAEKVDAQREDARDAAGARQAATGERIVLNAGRSRLWEMQRRDPAVIGYARVSKTGTPCGWCAMLISRGFVYKSASSAKYGEDGDLYHDNCKCVAVPIYSKAQWSDSQFDLNREYGELWPKVTRGLTGEEAVSAWRKFIRARQVQEATG